MATAKEKISIQTDIKITLELNELEAAALHEMTKYGIKSFLEGYKKQLGEHYIRPHEKGLTELFRTIGSTLPPALERVKRIKSTIDKDI